jgi:hypothetical protein
MFMSMLHVLSCSVADPVFFSSRIRIIFHSGSNKKEHGKNKLFYLFRIPAATLLSCCLFLSILTVHVMDSIKGMEMDMDTA